MPSFYPTSHPHTSQLTNPSAPQRHSPRHKETMHDNLLHKRFLLPDSDPSLPSHAHGNISSRLSRMREHCHCESRRSWSCEFPTVLPSLVSQEGTILDVLGRFWLGDCGNFANENPSRPARSQPRPSLMIILEARRRRRLRACLRLTPFEVLKA